MKFNRNLLRNQVPEWAASYIDYKGLKKHIKTAVEKGRQEQAADTAEFFSYLDRNLENVDVFYNEKYAAAARRLNLLKGQFGKSFDRPIELDRYEVEELTEVLLELHATLRKLQWYGEINRSGFVKITKKLDKKIPDHKQRGYVESKVDLKPFATNASLAMLTNTVNEWLLRAGDVNLFGNKSAELLSPDLSRASAKIPSTLSSSDWNNLDQAIRNDDASELSKILSGVGVSQESHKAGSHQSLHLALLERAIVCQSRNCISELLGCIEVLDNSEDIDNRNCIHRYIISLGRLQKGVYPSDLSDIQLGITHGSSNYITPAVPTILSDTTRPMKENKVGREIRKSDGLVSIFVFLLDRLSVSQRLALKAKDNFGRLALHYAAQYGLVAIVQVITTRMQEWAQFELANGEDATFCGDLEGLTPLHLSVIGIHLKTSESLLAAEDWRGERGRKAALHKHRDAAGEILSIATKANLTEIVRLLVDFGFDVNYLDNQGEAALHKAARFGLIECAKILITGSGGDQANLEIAEKTNGWTPLFIACVDGHFVIAEFLIQVGADLCCIDFGGWTAVEHAAFRGHIELAKAIAKRMPSTKRDVETEDSTVPTDSSLSEQKVSGRSKNKRWRPVKPVKSFGHDYLTDNTMILVSLGTMDLRKKLDPIKLERIPFAEAHVTQLDTALSVVISATGASGEPSVVDLPIQENISTEPITFMAKDAQNVKIMFDVVSTYSGSKDRIIGRGVALLSSIKPSLGSKRITLEGDLTVPIMSSHNLDVIGSVTFNFLTIAPFKHPDISTPEKHNWKSMASTMVIGHRGLGKNQTSKKALQLGENTIDSFITASKMGASYVEFDVQLTKDLVPVIYHDFLVSETGIDAPVHTLTLEQFMHMSDERTPHSSSLSSSLNSESSSGASAGAPHRGRHRSLSIGNEGGARYGERSERMQYTRDFKMKGFKANSRGNFIQAPFTTLEEMLRKLPEHIGFNIEMKYPMLFESEEQEMDTYAVDLNTFVDTVLKKVYDLGVERNIVFSSFHPDICLLLSMKQSSFPILFLTDAGSSEVGDVRASSLQEAIRFASRWNLLGIVSTAEPLVLCPKLVRVVKDAGLVCVSYGTLNNDPEKVKLQVQEGIDAVIVDSVLAVCKGLNGANGASVKED